MQSAWTRRVETGVSKPGGIFDIDGAARANRRVKEETSHPPPLPNYPSCGGGGRRSEGVSVGDTELRGVQSSISQYSPYHNTAEQDRCPNICLVVLFRKRADIYLEFILLTKYRRSKLEHPDIRYQKSSVKK